MLPTRNKASSAESRTRAKPRKPGGSHCTTLTSEITPRMMMPCLGDLSKRQTQSTNPEYPQTDLIWQKDYHMKPCETLFATARSTAGICTVEAQSHLQRRQIWQMVIVTSMMIVLSWINEIQVSSWSSKRVYSIPHMIQIYLQSYIYYIYDHTWSYMAIRNNTTLCWKQGMLHAAMKFVDASTTALAKNRLISQLWAVIKVCRTKLSNELSNCQMSNAQCEQIHKLWTTFEQMSISFVQYHPRDVNTTPTTPRPSGLGWCKR